MQQMADSKNGVRKQHSRASIKHHLAHLLFWLGPVAVDWALAARRFSLAIWAAIEPGFSIFKQGGALLTQAIAAVMLATVYRNHRRDSFEFFTQLTFKNVTAFHTRLTQSLTFSTEYQRIFNHAGKTF